MTGYHTALARYAFAAALSSTVALGTATVHADALTDARTEGATGTALALNRELANEKIEVRVAGAHVVLDGVVASEQNKALAAALAKAVSGSESVDNKLAVDPSLAERPPVKSPQQIALDDLTLASAIRSRLAWSVSTAGAPIEVSVDGGVVTLKGQAITAQAKEWAGTLAASTDGAIVVNNLISLRAADTRTSEAETQARQPDEAVSDGWIASKVARSFQYERSLDALRLDVKAREGIITLSGEVDSQPQKAHAVAIASQIRGVRGVDADLVKVGTRAAL
ncbi:BON domain-containing protein [Pseudomonas sp. Marseille-Q5115]|uniref:BON domain-containing protein n=1 Tax=Pseudomonas sp. Marseille-Q5115 TaxID=2866593 RepID=UPI001CE46FBE|nr:BON domain-containing protein [Pseudomonas sp. Marseille-Q5115]